MDSQDMDEASRMTRVVLVVPKQHVKTVKSSLERCDQLDRNNKIIPQPEGQHTRALETSAPGEEPTQDAPRTEDPTLPQSNDAPSPSNAAAAHQDPVRFPRFKFDAPSGEYVQPPALKFDALSGEYVNPSVLQERARAGAGEGGQGDASGVTETSLEQSPIKSASPKLKFDPVSGEYVEPSTLKPGNQTSAADGQQRMRIPTTIPYTFPLSDASEIVDDDEAHEFKSMVLDQLGLSNLIQDIGVSYHVISATSNTPDTQSPLRKALKEALISLPEGVLAPLNLNPEALVSIFPDGYCVYKPMLLLPHNAFSSEPWMKLLSTHPADSNLLRPVWQRIAQVVGATHVAINSPIPLQTSTASDDDDDAKRDHGLENILRSPVNLTPMYGDFGPVPTRETMSSPTEADFKNALWVSTRQNGIWQTWAPLYTMFSRGNIREKARILNLASVTTGLDDPSTAADLYAGIGYFAFSYQKSGKGRASGIKRVVCWEMNLWSVEGLRRGAEMNGWTCQIVKEDMLHRDYTMRNVESTNFEDDLIVFQTSNEHADVTYASMETESLPVRHVNLGLLPSSRLSWKSAVRILNFQRRGWVHVHENVGSKDIEARAGEIGDEFQRLTDEWSGEKEDGHGARKSVSVEHVERVKMYAPGVIHCVFDVIVGSN